VKRPPADRPAPPAPNRKRSTAVASPLVSTVPGVFPPVRPKSQKPARRVAPPQPALRPPRSTAPPPSRVARLIDEDESTLLDLIDNLLSKGVMLNADLILALANVDLVYIRLSALLCAADRVLPSRRSGASGMGGRKSRRSGASREGG
jgi:hypothetical protein